MPDFIGTSKIYIHAGTIARPISLYLPATTVESANDGALPYGTTISSAEVTIWSPGKVDVTTSFLDPAGAVVRSGLIVDFRVTPSTAVFTAGSRTYRVQAKLTLTDGSTVYFDADRLIFVGDR